MRRITEACMPTYVSAVYNPYILGKIITLNPTETEGWVGNISDYVASFVRSDIHNELIGVRRTNFRVARNYMIACCENTSLVRNTLASHLWLKICRIFLLEMSALQLQLLSRNYLIQIVPTMPLVYWNTAPKTLVAESFEFKPVVSFEDVQPFVSIIDQCLALLAELGDAPVEQIDVRTLLQSEISSIPLAWRAIYTLGNLLNNKCCFGGFRDE